MNAIQKMAIGGALAVASVVGSAIGASFVGIANAATSSTSSTSSTGSTGSTSSAAPSTQTAPAMPAHGSAAHEDAETAVTGSAATQAQAAAVKYVGSGTAGAVTTDYTKNGYEVTVTKADGTQVEVHLDSSFNVMTMPQGPAQG
jgi:hypothetical protein